MKKRTIQIKPKNKRSLQLLFSYHNLAASYVHYSSASAGSTAEVATNIKLCEYSAFSDSYNCYMIAIETLGPHLANNFKFIADIP